MNDERELRELREEVEDLNNFCWDLFECKSITEVRKALRKKGFKPRSEHPPKKADES